MKGSSNDKLDFLPNLSFVMSIEYLYNSRYI